MNLQERRKWNRPVQNLTVGDVVLVKDEHSPRNAWSMGRVIMTEPDKEGLVRSVLLKTQTSELRRPVNKLVLLLSNEDQTSAEDEC